MATINTVLLGLAEQMYEDIKFVAQLNPTQVVDDDSTRMFNGLLNEVRINCPGAMGIISFEEMTPRTLKYKDALVVVGQLRMLLRISEKLDLQRLSKESLRRVMENESLDESLDTDPPPASRLDQPVPADRRPKTGIDVQAPGTPARRATPRPVSPAATPAPASYSHDPELYGEKPPVRLNDDGTVPFVLDDAASHEGTSAFMDHLRDESEPDFGQRKTPQPPPSPSRIQQMFSLRDRGPK